MAMLASATPACDLTPLARALDRAAETVGVDFVGGFSALVQKGMGDADLRLIDCIPEALATTQRVCSSVNLASLRAGINMDAVLKMAQVIKATAERTVDINCYGAAKLVVFANMVEDSPFMAGAVHGTGEGGRGHQRRRLRPRRHGGGAQAACLPMRTCRRWPRPSRPPRSRSRAWASSWPARRRVGWACRWASWTSRLPPPPPSATRWRRSWRSSAWGSAAAPAPRRLWPCSTTR